MNEADVDEFVSFVNKLEELFIGRQVEIGNDAVSKLLHYGKNLRVFLLSHAKNITIEAFLSEKYVRGCYLTELWLYQCTTITPQVVQEKLRRVVARRVVL